MQLDLVDSRRDLETRVCEESLKICDGKVRNTNVFHASRFGQLLHLRPCILEVPVGVVLFVISGIGR